MKTAVRKDPKVEVADIGVTHDPGGDTEALKSRIRMLSWLSAILAVAVIALGAWLIFDGDGESTADLTPVQEQMVETLDAYAEAWNEADGAAAVALMSRTGYFDNFARRYYANPPQGEGNLEQLVDSANSLGFSAEIVDVEFIDDWVVTTERRPVNSPDETMSIFHMSVDGTKIIRHFAL